MSEISTDTAGTLHGIYDLLRISFPREAKYSLEYLKWLYIDNPNGVTISSNLIVENNVRATYSVLPMQYFWEGDLVKAALSLNTATHPDERGRGWFTKLAKITYESAHTNGIKIILGVANDNSIKGFLKHLGFESVGRISLRFATPEQHHAQMTRNLFGACRSDDFWNWRVGNPSASYSKIVRRCGSLLVATRKAPIVIGKLDGDLPHLNKHPVLHLSPIAPAYLYSTFKYGIDIPRKLLPSPWHFIIKNNGLSDSEFAELKKTIWFHGVDSDTF